VSGPDGDSTLGSDTCLSQMGALSLCPDRTETPRLEVILVSLRWEHCACDRTETRRLEVILVSLRWEHCACVRTGRRLQQFLTFLLCLRFRPASHSSAQEAVAPSSSSTSAVFHWTTLLHTPNDRPHAWSQQPSVHRTPNTQWCTALNTTSGYFSTAAYTPHYTSNA
jgi:hypothetical protein